jgi:hypothetical protein
VKALWQSFVNAVSFDAFRVFFHPVCMQLTLLKHIRLHLLIVWGCLFTIAVVAQPSFTTRASGTQIAKGELLEVSYELTDAEIDEFFQPEFKGWQIVSGPNLATSSLTINGQRSSRIAYQFVLKPLSIGMLIVPGGRIKTNGKELSSSPLSIDVGGTAPGYGGMGQSNTGQGLPKPGLEESYDAFLLKPGEDASRKIADNLFLKVNVSKTSCYVGEPLVADYLLFSRVSLNASVTRRPSFNGFAAVDLADAQAQEYTLARMNGKVYRVYLVRRVQLYPLQSGTQSLTPVEIDATVQFRKIPSAGESDAYSQDRYASVPYTVKSEPVQVEVTELPAQGRPAGYKGLVGRFEIKTRLEQNRIARKQAGKLIVEVSGAGHWAMVVMPKVDWPTGIESFVPTESERIDSQSIPISGTRTYSVAFASNQPGNFSIPPLVIQYFDPWQKAYKTATSQPLELVVENRYKEGTLVQRLAPVDPNQLEATDIFTDFVTIVFPLAALALLTILLMRTRRRRRELAIQKWEDKLAAQPLFMQNSMQAPGGNAAGMQPNEKVTSEISLPPFDPNAPQPYCTAARQRILGYLHNFWGIKETSVQGISAQLVQRGMNPSDVQTIALALEQLNMFLFNPFAASDHAIHLQQQVRQALTRLDRRSGNG